MRVRPWFIVTPVDEHGDHTACSPRCDVAPPIAHDVRCREIDAVALGTLEQKAWRRLAAIAAVPVIVKTDEEIIDRQLLGERRIDGFDDFAA